MADDEPAAVWVETEKLLPWIANPRANDEAVDDVVASIERFGFGAPIVARKADQEIIAGHTRLKAALRLGLERVPVRFMDLSPDDAHALGIGDNKTGERATWLDAGLREQMKLQLARDNAPPIAAMGFDEKSLAKLMREGAPPTDPTPPAIPSDPITKLGDHWRLGEHRLLCGDATIPGDVAKLFGAKRADLLLTDPPYGVSYVGKTGDALTIANDDLDEEGLRSLIVGAFDLAQRYSRAGAYWYATVAPGPLHLLFANDWKRRGILRQIIVWVKNSLVLGHSEYHYRHEPILFGWVPGERHKNEDRTRTTVWEFARPASSPDHPTTKPVPLWAQAINDGSKQGETVYDPFMGSGTTVVACEQLGRRAFGIELSPAYCDVIVERWQNCTGGKATRAKG